MGGDESAVLERLSSLAESSSVQLGWLEEMELPAERPSSSASVRLVRETEAEGSFFVQREWSSCVRLVLAMSGELAFSGAGGASVCEPNQKLYVAFSVFSVSSFFDDSSSYGALLY